MLLTNKKPNICHSVQIAVQNSHVDARKEWHQMVSKYVLNVLLLTKNL